MRARLLALLILILATSLVVTGGLAQDVEPPPPEVTTVADWPDDPPAQTGVIVGDVNMLPPLRNPIPQEIASHFDDWPLPHKDYQNTRATFDTNINSSNVNQLEVAWSFPIPGRADYGAAASAPIIMSGVVYLQDLESNVFALDLYTGQLIWEARYGKVFVISGVDQFSALDMNTGTEVWSVSTGDRPTGAFQPIVFDDVVYYTTQAGVGGQGDQSFRGYAGGTSGHILGIDPETGETLWDFQTVEEGFWGNPEVNSGGGVWFSPAIDTTLGLTYWGTGNPAPFPGTFAYPNATSRLEPNLYSNSLLALAHETGELIWYNHLNPDDLFDLDLQLSPMIAPVTVAGQQREMVFASGKLGEIFGLDRLTGELIWSTPVGIHQNDDVIWIPPDQTITVYPGVLGGVETPMAFADGTVYAPVLNLPTDYTATAFGAMNGTEAVEAANQNTAIGQGTSEVVALDAATGQVLWTHEFDQEMYGGATVVNDLLFVATFDGRIYALNRASGEIVWSYQAPSGINAWPAVADDMIIWPAGFGDDPRLIALRLPVDAIAGTTPEATAAPEATEMLEGEDGATEEASQQDANTGDGAASGGDLTDEYMTVDADNQTVTLQIIAAEDDTNGGMNFNGHANGEAAVTVPEGWTVEVEFSNQGELPHSAVVVPQDAVDQQELPEPVFEGASTSDPQAGTTEPESFSFTAEEQGTYVIACGVPGHASQGQWIVFEVAGEDAQPAFMASGAETQGEEAGGEDGENGTAAANGEGDSGEVEDTAEQTGDSAEQGGQGEQGAQTDQAGADGSSEYLTVDTEHQTVALEIIAAEGDANGGMNFNGYAHGEATITVPEGWTVEVNFSNESSLPHSSMIVPRDSVDQQQLPDPVFEGAATSDPYAGTTGTDSYSFTASEQGTYAMACGVPGHSSQGQWVVFEVAGSDAEPLFEGGSAAS